jgi:hypothetical protein
MFPRPLVLFFALALIARAEDAGFAQFSKHLLIVEGNAGRGSASVIKIRGNPLIVTNAHVLSGNSRVAFRGLNNASLKANTFGVAQNADIAVFTQDEVKEGLEMLEKADQHAAVGDEVLVLGNSLGGQVATELRGKIVGIGPELVEIDAKFVQGNSGSPIIHLKTGKVIGIATFATFEESDPLVDDSRFKEVRRFGVRLDTVTKWEYPTWEKFTAETRQMEAAMQGLAVLIMLANDLSDDSRVDAQHYRQADDRVRRRITELTRDLDRPRMAGSYYAQKKADFLRWIINETVPATPALNPDKFTRYHARTLERMLVFRERIRGQFQMIGANQSDRPEFDLLPKSMRERRSR